MQIGDAIKNRKSVRSFLDTKVDWRKILMAIDYSRFAPMAGGLNSVKFILVSEKNKIEKLAEASQQDFFSNANHIVVAVSDDEKLKRNFEIFGEKFARQQAGAMIQNFLLGLEEQGLSTCWVGHFVEEKIKEILSIPEKLVVEAIFPIGKKSKSLAQKNPAQKPELENMIYFNKWKEKKMEPQTRVSYENM